MSGPDKKGMVGPEGRKTSKTDSSLQCQTGENRLIDAKELFQGSSNPEPPDSERKSPDGPASTVEADLRNLGQAQNTPDDTEAQGRDWSWSLDQDDVVVPTQLAVAVYEVPSGRICIRQEADCDEEADSYILLHPRHLDALIERLTLIRRHTLGGGK
ncbi:hypothetical protein [Dongia sp.]|uniref:hypothetical protein n=1 Tax=Dongia sp. TaxID=1977262 RepID=UPI0035B373AE